MHDTCVINSVMHNTCESGGVMRDICVIVASLDDAVFTIHASDRNALPILVHHVVSHVGHMGFTGTLVVTLC